MAAPVHTKPGLATCKSQAGVTRVYPTKFLEMTPSFSCPPQFASVFEQSYQPRPFSWRDFSFGESHARAHTSPQFKCPRGMLACLFRRCSQDPDRAPTITKCAGPQSSERQWGGLAIYPVSRQLVRRLLIELSQNFPGEVSASARQGDDGHVALGDHGPQQRLWLSTSRDSPVSRS